MCIDIRFIEKYAAWLIFNLSDEGAPDMVEKEGNSAKSPLNRCSNETASVPVNFSSAIPVF
jgi:hypothetical protein